jgi:hypothetical protein
MPAAASVFHRSNVEDQMLDLIFLCLGLGGFALMAAYAALCGRL